MLQEFERVSAQEIHCKIIGVPNSEIDFILTIKIELQRHQTENSLYLKDP